MRYGVKALQTNKINQSHALGSMLLIFHNGRMQWSNKFGSKLEEWKGVNSFLHLGTEINKNWTSEEEVL